MHCVNGATTSHEATLVIESLTTLSVNSSAKNPLKDLNHISYYLVILVNRQLYRWALSSDFLDDTVEAFEYSQ